MSDRSRMHPDDLEALGKRVDALVNGLMVQIYTPGVREHIENEAKKLLNWIIERHLEDDVRAAVNEKFKNLTLDQIVAIAIKLKGEKP